MEINDAKQKYELQKTIKDSYNLIKRDTEYIPDLNTLNDDNKGQWVEHDQSDFSKMFDGLLDYCADEEYLDNLDWNSVNYTLYGADYYRENFPGFSDEVYDILAKSTEPENKLIDNRIPPLKITEGEFTISFD